MGAVYTHGQLTKQVDFWSSLCLEFPMPLLPFDNCADYTCENINLHSPLRNVGLSPPPLSKNAGEASEQRLTRRWAGCS